MKRILITAAVALVALSSACGTTGGQAKPGPTSAAPTSDTTAVLDTVKPCDLLTEDEVKSFGLDYPGTAQKTGAADECVWKALASSHISAGIRPKDGLKDLNVGGDKNSDIKVGKFDAVRSEGFEGAKNICAVLISVTPTSSITVISILDLSSTDMATACDRAEKAADKVAAKLP
ncbi:DUF3558 family protein [Lentzea sp. NPDC003310]|uniref:DUF3558 family protein n=1 Tax=Lentzea sp. NPDC003310 TaxID=3154447 RepID=UPI0033BCCE03